MDGFKTLFRLGRITSDEDDFGTSIGIPLGDGSAELACATNDDSGFALKREEFKNGGHEVKKMNLEQGIRTCRMEKKAHSSRF